MAKAKAKALQQPLKPSVGLLAEGVSELGLPRRPLNACVALGIKTIGELASYTGTSVSK